MGLYDRDYMRRPVAGGVEERAGQSRLTARRRLLIGVGLVLLVAAMMVALF